MSRTDALPFIKMHGLGNDFIVLDGRDGSVMPDPQQMQRLADRHRGIGCDQIMVMMPAPDGADLQLEMFNADGSAARACGNGTRAVAHLLMAESGCDAVTIATVSGLLPAWRSDHDMISVDMGPVRRDWQQIPLREPADTMALDLGFVALGLATCVSVGNPHAVFFVDDADAVDINKWGPLAETHPMFPDRANIEFVTLRSRTEIRMRVWERGAGITLACGSGACAAAAASILHGHTDKSVTVQLDGGPLQIDWQDAQAVDGGHIIMSGPVAYVASGLVTADFLSAVTNRARG